MIFMKNDKVKTKRPDEFLLLFVYFEHFLSRKPGNKDLTGWLVCIQEQFNEKRDTSKLW